MEVRDEAAQVSERGCAAASGEARPGSEDSLPTSVRIAHVPDFWSSSSKT